MDDAITRGHGRRALLTRLGAAGCLAWAGCSRDEERPHEPSEPSAEPEVTPIEDLVREHGVLQRVLLVYGEAGRRIAIAEPFDVDVVARAADLVRRFVEEYHEHTEEQFVFPVLERAGREVELVAVLRRQHERGRETTASILAACAANDPASLAAPLAAFERMYRPHAAREDTVLFPAFRETVGAGTYRELGEQFEEEETARFGPHGMEDTLAEIDRLEGAFGIGDLATFTP